MALEKYRKVILPAIEQVLKNAVQPANSPGQQELFRMLCYHLGWEGEGAGPKATGKRVRPTLLLLTCAAAGGNWQQALPAAAAVELLHNFSLIHDDIQDQSHTRRGRPTLWSLHGTAQAINAGDAMFSLAHISLESLEKNPSLTTYASAVKLLLRTSLHLTQGQYLDLAYESEQRLSSDAYWPMIWGKTAVLIQTCARLGSLLSGAPETTIKAFTAFGEKLGLAYQVHDDLLGIWGDPDEMGKSAYSDLVSGKKSLPVLFALQKEGKFAKRWSTGGVPVSEVGTLAQMLEDEGAREYTRQEAIRLTSEALKALKVAAPAGDAGAALAELTEELGRRDT